MTCRDLTLVQYVYKEDCRGHCSPSSYFVLYSIDSSLNPSDWFPHPSSWLPLHAERDSPLSEGSLSLVETC
jgi:hypothetical protein